MTTPGHERMSSVDTAWLRMDGAASTMMIVGVSVTGTPVRPDDFRRMIEQRLLCFTRFRRRVAPDALGASWVEDDAFDLDSHLVSVELPAPAGKDELQALVSRLASETLDPRRPMWQVHLVEHYERGSAWIIRVHHCYADGIAMIRVLLSMTEQDSGPALTRRPARPSQRPDVLPVLGWLQQLAMPAGDILENALAEGAKLLESGVHQLFHPGRAAALAGSLGGMAGELVRVLALPDDPGTPLRGSLSGEKAVAWAPPIPLHEVKTIGRALGCSINDVLMSTVAGALGGHLRDQGFDTRDLRVRASVPVNLREADEPLSLGNRFGLVFVELALGLANPLQRLEATHGAMAALKGSLQPTASLMSLGLMGMLPAAAQAPLVDLFSRKASAVVSNVPGPQAPLYLCGQRVTEMYFWVPQSGSIGLGISILSYAGQVHFGMIADRALVPSPAGIVERFPAEFEKLLLATVVGALALRKLPKPRIDTVQQTARNRPQ
jgi:diacylglycerol O-acyltransferase / wax synthase